MKKVMFALRSFLVVLVLACAIGVADGATRSSSRSSSSRSSSHSSSSRSSGGGWGSTSSKKTPAAAPTKSGGGWGSTASKPSQDVAPAHSGGGYGSVSSSKPKPSPAPASEPSSGGYGSTSRSTPAPSPSSSGWGSTSSKKYSSPSDVKVPRAREVNVGTDYSSRKSGDDGTGFLVGLAVGVLSGSDNRRNAASSWDEITSTVGRSKVTYTNQVECESALRSAMYAYVFTTCPVRPSYVPPYVTLMVTQTNVLSVTNAVAGSTNVLVVLPEMVSYQTNVVNSLTNYPVVLTGGKWGYTNAAGAFVTLDKSAYAFTDQHLLKYGYNPHPISGKMFMIIFAVIAGVLILVVAIGLLSKRISY